MEPSLNVALENDPSYGVKSFILRSHGDPTTQITARIPDYCDGNIMISP